MPEERTIHEVEEADLAPPAAEESGAGAPPGAAGRRGDSSRSRRRTCPLRGSRLPFRPEPTKHWYVVKVQSGREESIKEAIERRVKIEGVEEYFSKIIIPVEKTAEMRNGKRVVKERKLYPGYLMVEVEYNDRILYLFRETSGVGDFVGGSLQHAPPPMTDREVERMLGRQGEKDDVKIVHQKPKYDRGDRVKVKEGTLCRHGRRGQGIARDQGAGPRGADHLRPARARGAGILAGRARVSPNRRASRRKPDVFWRNDRLDRNRFRKRPWQERQRL